jgi:hypothetical protein
MSRKASAIRLAVLAAPVLLGLGCWTIWHFSYPSFTHRYRLTLAVEVDGVLRHGASVAEVTWQSQPSIFGPFASRFRGQVVAVDLDRHGMLLALPTRSLALRAFGGNVPELPYRPPPEVSGYPLDPSTLRSLDRLVGRTVDLDTRSMPQLVWLPDRKDLASARLLPSTRLEDEIAPEVRWRGAWLLITHDPVTTDLFQRLPSLAERHLSERGRGIVGTPGVFTLRASDLTQGIEP